jgi:COP9 signalosome complex subunit 1
LKLVLAQVLSGGDVKLYKHVAEKASVPVDQQWCVQTEKDATVLKEKLDTELNAAKASLMKDEIRRCHNSLGDLYYNRNDLNSAFKCYVRTRDYCSSSAQVRFVSCFCFFVG